MRQYGFNKATEFTKKQINVIYCKAKNGELKVEKWLMSEFYDLADYYGYDSNRNVEYSERRVLRILEAMFSGNIEEAQELINDTADSWYADYSAKGQAKRDRNLFVA
jgi:hypothetical protein